MSFHSKKSAFLWRKEIRISSDFPFWISKYKDNTIGLHRHDFFELFYVVEGKGFHYIEGHKTLLSKGDMFMINPKEAHRFVIPRNDELIIICCTFLPSMLDEHISTLRKMRGFFDFAYLSPFYRSKKEKLHFSGTVDITIKNLLEEMLEEFNDRKFGYKLAIKANLLNLLVVISRAMESLIEKRDWVDVKRNAISNVLQYVNEHYKEKLQLKQIANIANMGPNYFCRVFKKITARTFIEYINDLRLTKACLLLKETDLTVSEICYDVGFSDLSNFEHIFKKYIGIPPLKYRIK